MQENHLLQITRYGMGHGDAELAIKLVASYFKILIEDKRLPSIITFYNEGVKLLAAGSPVISLMQEAEKQGVKLLACKTCLDYYQITDNMAAGVKGTMMDIITLQSEAAKVINL
ncbi:DsrE family protein [Carboxylicivirga sp. N1Y90]|uniref:DsrE family protein n=1 Tax=Carboxylicivirga fragile TaxID=3417571 RepID=UPI003D34A5E8|nr:DsrE family protein [Marinilabiliaceae bacterium N1Y90]